MVEINVGDTVVIKDAYKKAYHCYREWIILNCPHLMDKFFYSAIPNDGTKGTVACIAPHSENIRLGTIYAVETNNVVWLMGEGGIDLIAKQNAYGVELL